MADVQISLRHSFGEFALDLSFSGRLERLAIFGPSGCGKSTVLDCLSGLLRPERGRFVFEGRTLLDTAESVHRPPEERRVGYLMQNAPLFPHRTVRENIRFGPRARTGTLPATVVEGLEIGDLLSRSPAGLSGGERRRVALAQVIASKPDWLLLDEPLVGLDESLRARTLPVIHRVLEDLDLPTLVVSHRPDILMPLSSRVLPLVEGSGGEVYPTEAFFQNDRFRDRHRLGETNYFEVEVTEREEATGLLTGRTDRGLAFRFVSRGDLREGDRAVVSFSSREPILGVRTRGELSPRNRWSARVQTLERGAGSWLVTLNVEGETVWARVTARTGRDFALETGADVDLLLKSHALRVQPA